MRTVKGWGVAGGGANLPRPLTSGLNFNEQQVPHARRFWVLSASLSLADRRASTVGHAVQSVGSGGQTRHYIRHSRSHD